MVKNQGITKKSVDSNLDEEEKEDLSNSIGKVRIKSILLEEEGENIKASIVLINGISKELMIRQTPLLLINNNQIAGEVIVDFKDTIFPPLSSTPLEITLDRSGINLNDMDNWSIVFKYYYGKIKLDSSFLKKLTNDQEKELINTIKELPKLKFNEIRLYGNQCKLGNKGNLHLQVLLGNGYTKQIALKKIPLKIVDAQGDLVSAISFNIHGLSIEPQSWRMINLVIPKDKLLKNKPDLSKWEIGIFRPIKSNTAIEKKPLQ